MLVPPVINALMSYYDDWRHAVLVFSILLAVANFLGALVLRPLEIEAPTLKEMVEMEKMIISSNAHLNKLPKNALETIKETEAMETEVGHSIL